MAAKTYLAKGKQMDYRLIYINRFIRKNYSEPLTLNQLAELIQCNATYLSNTYSKVFDISPIQHHQQVRMNYSLKLLISTNYSIGKISSMLGYVSTSQFIATFKRHYQVTPLQYRRVFK